MALPDLLKGICGVKPFWHFTQEQQELKYSMNCQYSELHILYSES